MADAYLQQMFSYRATSTWAPTDSELGQYSVDELIVYMDYLVNAGGTATSTAGLDRALKRIPDAMPAKRALVLAKEGSGPEQVFQSWSDAVDCGGALLALAVKRASQLAFGLADPRRMLRVTEKGYACWKGMGPQERLRTWMRFVPGVHAFALEQNQMLQDAESIGKAAVEEFADDPWAVHGVAHALYYQVCRPWAAHPPVGRAYVCMHWGTRVSVNTWQKHAARLSAQTLGNPNLAASLSPPPPPTV